MQFINSPFSSYTNLKKVILYIVNKRYLLFNLLCVLKIFN